MRVRWTARAARQLDAVIDFLDSERAGSGTSFLAAMDLAIDVMIAHPLAFPVIPDTPGSLARRALIRPWQEWLIYEVRADEATILVLAVWSARQAPGGWRRE